MKMNELNLTTDKIYEEFGISEKVHRFGEIIIEELSERFKKIDETAEYNQLKVLKAMQDNKVSEACLMGTTGYGYNDIGKTLPGLPATGSIPAVRRAAFPHR